MNPLDTLLPPAELPTGVAGEIDNIEAEIRRFQSGELQPERFRSFRLAWGIYGQRQPGVQMIRVKIPGGVLNGGQMARLAAISEEFSTGISHLTTRQDVQFHYVQLDRVGDLLRRLAEVGLTTREACGNSVRNVTACPLTGFIADELFDVAPYAQAVWAYLSRNPFCQQMARKFKIAISSCPEDCALTAIHDIGFVGRVDRAGGHRFGFRVLVGGGLGTTPFVARVLDDFVPLDDILPVTRSILKVFAAEGNRRNKMKARLKYVVHRLGIETFRERVAEARRNLTFEERDEARLDLSLPDEYRAVVERHRAGNGGARPDSGSRSIPAGEEVPANGNGRGGPDPGFRSWQASSVRPHRDPARAVVTVLTPLGDLNAPSLRAVARLATSYSGDEARIAAAQNIVLPNVARDRLRFLYDDLAAAGLAEAGVGSALDVTSCPGADTCSLGITSSKGLTREIRSELTRLAGEIGLEALGGVTIKVSGCPNACGQHHIANIGLHGVVKKVGGQSLPAYQVHIGGGIAQGGATIGRVADKIVARRVPGAVAALLRTWAAGRRVDESFPDYAGRAPEEIAAALRPF
ncbi:MAG TPA: nitrite/sulfite reductase, partial [Arenibaculum sp.]|nr:nitrite/sulfite reductase [Arenibaculum sp.]